MAEEPSEKDQKKRGGSADEKISGADQTGVDDAEVSSEAPSRVHIFKGPGKSSPASSPKSHNEPLQCSSFRSDLFDPSPRGIGPAAVCLGFQPPIVSLKGELIRLKIGVAKGTKALYEAAMKAEDLEAILQALQRTRHNVSKRRK